MGDPRSYEIRLFDRTLVEFALVDGVFFPEVAFVELDGDARELMPCGFTPTPDGVWNWLEMRSIPTNRRNAARICRELGFDLGDLEALYRASLGLSLNDSYWVVPRGFKGRFDDYNLYENPFSEAIGALALSGETKGGRLAGNTPELTTDGTLRKGWRIIDNVLAPGRRVAALDSFVRQRAIRLLEIPPVDHEALRDSLQVAMGRRDVRQHESHRLQVLVGKEDASA